MCVYKTDDGICKNIQTMRFCRIAFVGLVMMKWSQTQTKSAA